MTVFWRSMKSRRPPRRILPAPPFTFLNPGRSILFMNTFRHRMPETRSYTSFRIWPNMTLYMQFAPRVRRSTLERLNPTRGLRKYYPGNLSYIKADRGPQPPFQNLWNIIVIGFCEFYKCLGMLNVRRIHVHFRSCLQAEEYRRSDNENPVPYRTGGKESLLG